jgi:hypothetical protein
MVNLDGLEVDCRAQAKTSGGSGRQLTGDGSSCDIETCCSETGQVLLSLVHYPADSAFTRSRVRAFIRRGVFGCT